MQTIENAISKLTPLDNQSSDIIFDTALDVLAAKHWYITHDGNNDKTVIEQTLFKKITQQYQANIHIVISDQTEISKTDVTQTCYCIQPILGKKKYQYKYELYSNGVKVYSNTKIPEYMFNVLADLHEWVQERNPAIREYAKQQIALNKQLSKQSIH